MTANVSLQQIYFNPTILDFFFRKQARNTFEELINRAGNSPTAFQELEDAIEGYYMSLEDFEEDCYNLSAEEILDSLEVEYV